MEVGHRIAVVAVDLKPVADVDIAVSPEIGVVLPRSIDDVAVESETHWVGALGNIRDHVGGSACAAGVVALALVAN